MAVLKCAVTEHFSDGDVCYKLPICLPPTRCTAQSVPGCMVLYPNVSQLTFDISANADCNRLAAQGLRNKSYYSPVLCNSSVLAIMDQP